MGGAERQRRPSNGKVGVSHGYIYEGVRGRLPAGAVGVSPGLPAAMGGEAGDVGQRCLHRICPV